MAKRKLEQGGGGKNEKGLQSEVGTARNLIN